MNGKLWFTVRQRTSWSWQNRPASTWALICHLVPPQEPSCFNAVLPPPTGSRKRQSSEDKFYLFFFLKHRDQPTKSHWHWFEGHTTAGVEQAFITTADASFSCIFLKWQYSIFIIWHYSAFTLLHLILLNYPIAVINRTHKDNFACYIYQNLLQTLNDVLTIEEVLTFAFNVRRTLFHVFFFFFHYYFVNTQCCTTEFILLLTNEQRCEGQTGQHMRWTNVPFS